MPRYGKRILLVTAVIVALAAVMSLTRRIATVQRLQGDVNTLSVQAAEVSATVSALQTQIAKATQGVGEEEQLRGAGYARPGDEVIRPVPVEMATPTPKPASAEPKSKPPSSPPPWEIWWRLFFGSEQ